MEFDKLIAWQLAEAKINETTSEYGPGRVDAFGRIYNKVALLLGGPNAAGNAPDAPVSIPFIWHAPRRSEVQYNGIAQKTMVKDTDFGAVGRNTGEVIGVFGDIVPHANPSLTNGFSSSVKVGNLIGLEETLAAMRPPLWPAKVLGDLNRSPIGTERGKRGVDRGAELYTTNCVHCHEVVSRDPNPKNVINVKMNALFPPAKVPDGWKKETFPAPGTDPWMACNAFDYAASSGPLSGFKGDLISDGEIVPAEANLGFLLRTTVVATLVNQKGELIKNFLLQWIGIPVRPAVEDFQVASALSQKARRLQRCKEVNPYTEMGKNMGYTSRPLNGVWATAPFLHNGSIPTMYDLLSPAAKRPTSFVIGKGDYDPQKLGLAMTPKDGTSFEFNTVDDSGKPINGNSNAGHDYGNDKLSEDDRYAIIEYLKSL
jgi:hypothetical protein